MTSKSVQIKSRRVARPHSVFATTPQTGRSRSEFSGGAGLTTTHNVPFSSGAIQREFRKETSSRRAARGRLVLRGASRPLRDAVHPLARVALADLIAGLIFLPTVAMMKSLT